MITESRVFNLKGMKPKRTIDITKIGGITKNTMKGNEDEFVIHIPLEYDYRYVSAKRDQIIETLQKQFLLLVKDNLKIFTICALSLKSYCTTEKDMKKKVRRMPGEAERDKKEDLIEESKISLFYQEQSSDNYLDVLKAKMFKHSIEMSPGDYIIDEDDESTQVFSRASDDKLSTLEDFQILKVIGRGSFGKVFLV